MILFLMSSLRSGSHMVRSMLREDPCIVDRRAEHSPLVEIELARIYPSQDLLVPLKYGFGAFTADCLAADVHYQSAGALILHRLDAAAQARSLAHARRNGSWFGPTSSDHQVTVTPAELERQASRNAADLGRIDALRMPHIVVAYEDITVSTLKAAVDQLLQRDVTVVAPATLKIAANETPQSELRHG